VEKTNVVGTLTKAVGTIKLDGSIVARVTCPIRISSLNISIGDLSVIWNALLVGDQLTPKQSRIPLIMSHMGDIWERRLAQAQLAIQPPLERYNSDISNGGRGGASSACSRLAANAFVFHRLARHPPGMTKGDGG